MQLAAFIETNMERILVEWDAFARSLPVAGAPLDEATLRDHARQMLEAIALDLKEEETARERLLKSRGKAPGEADPETPAAEHGTLRHTSGYTLLQLTAEFRALRATVLRLWLARERTLEDPDFLEVIRFNENIDQALAQSVITYSSRVNRTRDTFLAMLGHDLRTPLSAMTMAGELLARPGTPPEVLATVGAQVLRSAATMATMVNDLLEYARTQMGGAVPLVLQYADITPMCGWAIDDARAAHPDGVFEWHPNGDLRCAHDSSRLQQVLANLLNNAAEFSDPGTPVLLVAQGEADAVVLQVCNVGAVIPAESQQAIFDPLVQLARDARVGQRPSTSIGLGLFIAREITDAHGGSIGVESSADDGTVFSVRLPRGEAPPASGA